MLAPAFAPIDLSIPDPVQAILASPEYRKAVQTFADSPSIKGALLPPDAQALLYSLIRLLRPEVAIEIGTYLASTTEAMARAIAANGFGTLHTVDPYGAAKVPNIIARWPAELRKVTELHLTDSMLFFAWMQKCEMRTDLVFVDGNHDYEFALFDIQCSARLMNAGGLIVIDNISQPGPFFAAQDFMERASPQGWRECGNALSRFDPMQPFDRNRTTIHNTDFCVLRAPPSISIGNRPITFGDLSWTTENTVLRLRLAEETVGKLYVQFIIRVFENPPREIIQSTSVILDGKKDIEVAVDFPSPQGEDVYRTVEPWLTFEGAGELLLRDFPSVC
jgi:predicted O-methyltransferase YrrM